MKQRDTLSLWLPAEVEAGEVFGLSVDHQMVLSEILGWSRAYLNTTNPDLGRDGPVCPFTKPAMSKELFMLTNPQVGQDIEQISATVLKFRDWYRELILELEGNDRNLLAFVIPLPDFDRSDPAPLDMLQAKLKEDFVRNGLMIGQFHPKCEQPGLWSEHFRPLQAPIPLLAIRIMVLYDLPFLMDEQPHVDAYLSQFARDIPAKVRAQLVSRLFARAM